MSAPRFLYQVEVPPPFPSWERGRPARPTKSGRDARAPREGTEEGHPRLDEAVLAFDGAPLSAAERPDLTVEDRALFIFTSRTTCFPNAANINHFRLMLAANAFARVMKTSPDDCIYACLPIYPTTRGYPV